MNAVFLRHHVVLHILSGKLPRTGCTGCTLMSKVVTGGYWCYLTLYACQRCQTLRSFSSCCQHSTGIHSAISYALIIYLFTQSLDATGRRLSMASGQGPQILVIGRSFCLASQCFGSEYCNLNWRDGDGVGAGFGSGRVKLPPAFPGLAEARMPNAFWSILR